jgi:hypothetical protein
MVGEFTAMLHCSGTNTGAANSQIMILHASGGDNDYDSPPVYVARRQDDGTWSIVESKTGRLPISADVC